MSRKITLICLLVNLVFSLANNTHLEVEQKNFIYNQYEYGTINTVVVNSTTEQILDFYDVEDLWDGYPTRVHVSSKVALSEDYPAFITALQQKGVSSWELPLVVETTTTKMVFNDMARTLCPHDAGPNTTTSNRPTIQISSSSPRNVSIDIQLKRVQDFYVNLDKEISFNATPSSPKYYYFSFDKDPVNSTVKEHKWMPHFNYTIPKSVVLSITSDDDVCAVVSIQNNSCPVFDNEREILYRGNRLTMTRKGGITITQEMYPVGFYIVFIVKQNDEDCTGVKETDIGDAWSWTGMEDQIFDNGPRSKVFQFKVVASITYKEYLTGALVLLGALISFAIFTIALSHTGTKWTEEIVMIDDGPGPSRVSSDVTEGQICDDDYTDSEPGTPELHIPILTVAILNKSRLSPKQRSDRYFWSSLTMAIIYALPVVQLLVSYQKMVHQTGNQDLCYYNFLCAHPLLNMSDFNHVYSNIGYVLFACLFAIQVRVRQVNSAGKRLGIALHPTLLYSLSLALAMEGILSACYHLCPNKMNFQFDSSYMYVISVLSMIKLYQNRHPDVNAGAHTTFMVISAVVALGVIGIMYPGIYFWVSFTILHLATCLFLTLKIYYFGKFKLEKRYFSSAYTALRENGRYAFLPTHTSRAILLAIANILNWALASYGLYIHAGDFAKHLLAILMGNSVLYIIFYVTMKLVYRERIVWYTVIYLVLATLAWSVAGVLFLDSRTKWSQTPAQSRRHNEMCTALDFYDTHDLWHALSAAALYLSLNVLLTIDDGLRDTPATNIAVF